MKILTNSPPPERQEAWPPLREGALRPLRTGQIFKKIYIALKLSALVNSDKNNKKKQNFFGMS